MKAPKKVNRFCPKCRKHTEHKVSLLSSGHKRGSLKRGSIQRAKKRGKARGMGNKGKWGSKPAVTKFKRKTKTNYKVYIHTLFLLPSRIIKTLKICLGFALASLKPLKKVGWNKSKAPNCIGFF